MAYNTVWIEEYFVPMKDDNSDNTIELVNSCPIHNITTIHGTQPGNGQSPSSNPKKRSTPLKEPDDKQPSFEEEWEDVILSSNAPIESYVSRDVYKEINLGTLEALKIIKVHEKSSKTEWQYWHNFFKRNIQIFA